MPFNAVCTVLEKDVEFAGRLSFNEAKNYVYLDGKAITNFDYPAIARRIQDKYRFAEVGLGVTRDAVAQVALLKRFDPVREYLEGLKWDGVERLKHIPRDLLAVEDADEQPLYGRYCEVWFISAVARVFEPGCKVENVLVLNGEQGSFKSTFLRVIASGPGEDYFTDNPIDISSRDGLDLISGSWIIEWAEFETILRSKSSGEVKQFLSTQTDRYRPAYAVSKITVPRRCVFAASTNWTEVHRDETGNRRYFTIPSGHRINIAQTRVTRDLLWAEAVSRYKAGEKRYLSDSEMIDQANLNLRFTRGNQVSQGVTEFLKDKQQVTGAEVQTLRDTYGANDYVMSRLMRASGFTPNRIRCHGVLTRVWIRNDSTSQT